MSSTTVHSNKQKYTSSVAGSIFKATEKTLEVPPKGQVQEVISTYIEEKGNMEIPAGKSKVNENNTLEKQDGTIIDMASKKAYQNLVANKEKKAQMKSKAENKGKEQTGVEAR